MSPNRTGWKPAAIGVSVALVVLVIGSAFARMSVEGYEDERREQARAAAVTAANALGAELESLMQQAADGEGIRLDTSGMVQGNRRLPGGLNAVPDAEWRAAMGDGSNRVLIGPFAAGPDELVLAVSAPLGNGLEWWGSFENLDTILVRAGLPELSAAGYEYNVRRDRALPRGRTSVARSRPTSMLDVVHIGVRTPDDPWTIEVRPRDGWGVGLALATNVALVFLVTVIAGVAGHHRARHRLVVDEIVAESTKRYQRDNEELLRELERRRKLELEIAEQRTQDELTRLPNRVELRDRLDRSLERVRTIEAYQVAVLHIGFDRLQQINDSLGERAGDTVLMEGAQRIDACLRPGDMLARGIGDTFIALVYDVGEKGVIGAAERVCQAIRKAFILDDHEVFLSVSVGIAQTSDGLMPSAEVLRRAETAMHRAKAEGGDQVALFDVSMREETATTMRLEADMRRALDRDEFKLYFQPIVSFNEDRVAGMEVLIRWFHPLEGMVPPDKFIPLAEETGFVVELSRWILKEAARQLQQWRDAELVPSSFYLSINLSGRDFEDPGLCDYVQRVIDETNSPAGAIRLEVTEGILMHNVKVALATVDRLRSMGVPLLLDDFGTGYSSMSYLHRFEFDVLKVDRSFVSRLHGSAKDRGILRAIVQLASNLDLKTVAEGVESQEDVVALRDLGCDYGQGYFYSKPIAVDDVPAMLEGRGTMTSDVPDVPAPRPSGPAERQSDALVA